MLTKKVQQLLFTFLFAISLSSSLYLNDQAEELRSQGFEISYFSTEDAEDLIPDVQYVDHFLGQLIGSFRLD